jgi:DNA-binding NarL/FixJ family response regulator
MSELLGPIVDIVAAVDDGRAALAAVESLDPDLVILDISMPEMNGIEVAQELSRRGKRAKIIFVTLHESPQMMAAAEAAGGLAYITKTGLNHDLVETVKSLLGLGAAKES